MTGMPTMMRVSLEPPVRADVRALTEELDACQQHSYPAASHHGVDVAALAGSDAFFAVARDESLCS